MLYASEQQAETTNNHAVIYIRVSSERQVENASLETQERTCLELCARNHWEVLQVFREEGESAKTANRTEFQKALLFCRKTNPRPRYFVVYHTDRFARVAMDHDAVRQTLLNWGVLLRSVCQQLGESPMDRFIERIWSGQAELDNEIRKEKTLGGMDTRLRQGNWTFKAPLGYKNEKIGGVKTIVPDPDRAVLIRAAFERYATGLHKRQSVLDWVNDKGLRTWQGKRLSTETFRRMLSNPLYAGRIMVQGKKGGAGQDWRIVQQGNFKRIVPEQMFDKVQGLLAGRRPTVAPRKRANPDFPLRQFVRCGCCDKPLTGSKSTSQTGDKYAYYHCQNKRCASQVRVPKQQLESDFTAFVQQLKPNPEYLPVFRESVIMVYEKKFAESLEVRDALERELRQKRDGKRKLNDAFIYRNAISEDDYHEMKEALEQEILTLEMKISDAKQDEIEIEQLLDFSENLLLNAAGTWSESGLEQKQRLQQILFPQGVSYSGGFYRTTVTNPMFNVLREEIQGREQLVALVTFAAMSNVWMLNFCYDVPRKIYSTHLVLMSLFLLLPDVRRLIDFFLLNCRTEPSPTVPLLKDEQLNRWALLFQIGIGAVALVVCLNTAHGNAVKYATHLPPPIRGIWSVDEFAVDGAVQPPLLTNTDRWQRVIFDAPDIFYFQGMDSRIGNSVLQLDPATKTFILTNPADPSRGASFTYEDPAPDRLILDGNLNGRHLNMSLHRTDLAQFLLLNRGLHMINQTQVKR